MPETTYRAYAMPDGKPPVPIAERLGLVIARHERRTGQTVTHVVLHDTQTVGLDIPGVVVTGRHAVAADTVWIALDETGGVA